MQTIDQMIATILAHEGGFVNDPDDPGGATNHGVTIHTMRRLRLDLDGDGDVDVEDVRILPVETAARIFKDHYLRAPRIDQLPEALQPSVFDMQVNAGSRGVKLLQQMLREAGHDPGPVDGVIGPRTIAAAEAVVAELGARAAIDAYAIVRRGFYYRLADRRPALRKFAERRDGGKGGWITRAESFMSRALHFTREQHDRRTATWA